MPKLLVRVFGDPGEDIYEFEEAGFLFAFTDRIVIIDGQEVHSYEELVKIVSQEKYKSQEFIEVDQIPAVQGG
jgi:PDZ domain-containing secreted protein